VYNCTDDDYVYLLDPSIKHLTDIINVGHILQKHKVEMM
jgi:hypothetical protein